MSNSIANPRGQKAAVLLTVRFRERSREEFVARYCRDVRRGKIVIRTRANPGVTIGTRVRLRFLLAAGEDLFTATGHVAWLGRDEECLSIGVQFHELAGKSLALYQEMLARSEQPASRTFLEARAIVREFRHRRRLAALGLASSAEFFAPSAPEHPRALASLVR